MRLIHYSSTSSGLKQVFFIARLIHYSSTSSGLKQVFFIERLIHYSSTSSGLKQVFYIERCPLFAESKRLRAELSVNKSGENVIRQ